MEKKYQDAIITGLKCGVMIAGFYLVINIIILYLNSTPAMVSYINYIAHPHTTSYPGALPVEYYLDAILDVVEVAAVLIGFLATGVYALRSGEQRKNTVNNIMIIGAIAGIAAFIPLFVGVVIFDIYTTAIGFPLSLFSLSSANHQGWTISTLAVGVFYCLSMAIIISAIISAAGAWGYAYFTRGIKRYVL